MFWEQFADDVVEERGVDSVLKRANFTLREVIGEDDVLQECAMSTSLIAYVEKEEVLEQLVDLIVIAGTEGDSKEERYRTPFVACEILCFGHPKVMDAFFAKDSALLKRLVRPLREDAPLYSLVAEYLSRVLLKLLGCRREKMLSLLRAESELQDLMPRLVFHLSNASIFNLLTLGVFMAGTEEVEVNSFSVGSDQGIRLKRLFDASCVSWLARLRFPAALAACVLGKLPSAAHALECLQKMVEFCPSNATLLQQLLDDESLRSIRDAISSGPTIQMAQLVELIARISKTWVAPCRLDILVEAVVAFCKYASLQLTQSSLGPVRLQCVILCACAVESLPLTDAFGVWIALLSEWFYQFPNANLFHVAFASMVRSALERGAPLSQCILSEPVAGRLVSYFRDSRNRPGPRSPCMGTVVQLLDAIRGAASPSFVESLGCPEVWEEVTLLLELQKKPLAGAVVGFVKRSSDFMEKADIDGIGEKK